MWRTIGIIGLTVSLTFAGNAHGDSAPAWTLEEALIALRQHPNDAYLQYVALQLAERDGQTKETVRAIEQLTRGGPFTRNRGRGVQADLYRLFSGAFAIQESLQLDTMQAAASEQDHPPKTIDIATLQGSQVRSHPWKEMLAGKEPTVSALSYCIPANQSFARFDSLNQLLDIIDSADIWSTHAISQTRNTARHHDSATRVQTQLAVEVHPEIRPFYRLAVGAVAATGNDLYLREGSDLTLLFEIRNETLFRQQMDGFLTNFQQRFANSSRSEGTVNDVPYVHLTTPERTVHVYSAYPRPDLHVRSNSLAGLKRVLKTIAADGVGSLGKLDEYRYVRTLMPLGAAEEDGFVYLSDPFIRRITGPTVKITERRRLGCYNHLKMISHASLMFRTEQGRKPENIAELSEHNCLPKRLGRGHLGCSEGGVYSISADSRSGRCTVHGSPRNMTPCVDLPTDKITQQEADEYAAFLNDYNSYWRTFFDPIAVRLQVQPEQVRMETIVLPLIDNSIYTAMAAAFGGAEPQRLDAGPISTKSIFTLAFQLDKDTLLKQYRDAMPGMLNKMARDIGFSADDFGLLTQEFLERGIDNQLALHVCDGEQHFRINYSTIFTGLLGSFGRGRGLGNEELSIGMLLSALNSPVYIAVPLRDQGIVDRYLDRVDEILAAMSRDETNRGWFGISRDSYRVVGAGNRQTRCFALTFGPIKWRLFWERIGDRLFVSSQKDILDELAITPGTTGTPAAEGHAVLQLRPMNWNKVLPHFRLGWAENNRHTCQNNLHLLGHVGRLHRAEGYTSDLTVEEEAERLHGIRPFCPEHGRYHVEGDGSVICTHHSGWGVTQQEAAPVADSPTVKLLEEFTGLTATLTFTHEGLRAVMTIDR